MTKHIRCLGYVFAGIGIVLGLFMVPLAAVGGVIWISAVTAAACGLPDWVAGPISLAYFAIIAGAIVGVALCREYA